jgi:hypothetical protein
MATLAEPPGALVVRTERSTGTGASGEMRSTSPQMERSSITSPMTRMRRAANPLSIREKARLFFHQHFLKPHSPSTATSSMTPVPIIAKKSPSCDWPILRGPGSGISFPASMAIKFPKSRVVRARMMRILRPATKWAASPSGWAHLCLLLWIADAATGVEGWAAGRRFSPRLLFLCSGPALPLGLPPLCSGGCATG